MVRFRSWARLFAAAGLGLIATTVLLAAPARAATHSPSVATLIARCTTQHVAPSTAPRTAMFRQLQCVRRTAGLPAFAQSSSIGGVAKRWSAAMASNDLLEHNPDLIDQAAAVDTRWQLVGEVIGFSSVGAGQVNRVVAAWLRSPVHRALLLDPRLKVVGIGLKSSGGRFWATLDLVDI